LRGAGAFFKKPPLPLGERKICLQVAFLIGLPVKSAFALLLARVTEPQTEKKGRDKLKRTISAMVGKGSINHNSRKFKAENVNGERSHLNIDYCNESIKKVYHELFDEALQRYNDKQTRSDRKIENYYEKIRSGKQEKPFHELILQIGDKDNMNAESENGQLARQVLDEYYREFQERNPNLYVFSAHLHMDEATPHLHIDFIPFTTGSKRGLDTRVSLKQALAKQGFKGGTRGDTEWNQWVQSEKEQLAAVMERYGIEWEHKGTHEKHLSVLDYKKQEREKEVAALNEQITEKTDEVKCLSNRVQNYDDGIENLKTIEQMLDTSPEYQLPEPQGLMTAKSYKTKFAEPLIKRLKSLIKTVFARCFEAWDSYHRLNATNASLYRENQVLSRKNSSLNAENAELKEQNRDYKLLRKVFGSRQIDSLLEQAKQSKQRDKRFRNKENER
jgi:cell division protein FtsB